MKDDKISTFERPHFFESIIVTGACFFADPDAATAK